MFGESGALGLIKWLFGIHSDVFNEIRQRTPGVRQRTPGVRQRIPGGAPTYPGGAPTFLLHGAGYPG